MMAQKRPLFHDGKRGGDGIGIGVSNDHQPKRRFNFKFNNSLEDLVSRMEPMIRNVVKEEVQGVFQKLIHSPQRPQVGEDATSRPASDLRLDFIGNLPSTIFTNSKVETEDNKPLQIALYDANSLTIIGSGALSSASVDIFVLDGDFGGSGDQEDWAESEFDKNIVRERDGKRPLIIGKQTVFLTNGTAPIENITFTDNSRWVRNGKFRLGAKIGCKFSCHLRIREATTQAFTVKDHRGEVYRKHYPPSLQSDVWRLDEIAKGGAFHLRLSSNGINTVKDFLRSLEIDPSSLRSIFGRISDKKWNVIVNHARTCVFDDQMLYKYQVRSLDVIALFNSIYKVEGAVVEGNTCSIDYLHLHHRGLVDYIKREAYTNLKDVIPVEGESVPFDDPPQLDLASFNNEGFKVPKKKAVSRTI